MTVKEENRMIALRSLKVFVFISAVYVGVIITALFLQYRQLSQVSLVDFPEIDRLKESVRTETLDTDLRLRIRYLDLVARRSWFSGIERMRSGGMLLAVGIIVLLLSAGGIRILRGREIPSIESNVPDEPHPGKVSIALAVMLGIVLISLAAIIFNRALDERQILPGPGPLPEKVPCECLDQVISSEEVSVFFERQKYNWHQFRGYRGDGVISSRFSLSARDIETGEGIIWKTELILPGFSSPIVWEDKVILTGGSETERSVFAYDLNTGELLWRRNTGEDRPTPGRIPAVSSDTGYAAPTPATNGEQVFAIFATGELLCVDLEGNRIWERDLGVPENHYGHSSSLLAVGSRLIVQFDARDRQMLYCFDANSGSVLWQTERSSAISWASPIYVEIEDKGKIVLVTSRTVETFDIVTGKKIWSNRVMSGEVAPSPVYADGRIYVANAYSHAVSIDLRTGETLWQTNEPYLPSVSSPTVLENMVFLFSGAISALDTATGEMLWEYFPDNEFYSSPLIFKDRIVIFDISGTIFVIRPDRDGIIIEEKASINESVVTTPAVVGEKMLVRGVKHLYLTGPKRTKK